MVNARIYPRETDILAYSVADSIAKAKETNQKNLEAGKYDAKRKAIFDAQIAEIEGSGADDDAKLIGIAQITGGMLLGAMTVANISKE